MFDHSDLATVLVLSALGIFLLMVITVVLLIVVRQRRVRHQADLVRMQLQHANAVRQVEREALDQALSEIGGELHDNVGQMLAAVHTDAQQLLSMDPDDPIGRKLENTVSAAIAEVRRLSRSLSTDHLHGRPLHRMLQEECERLHRPGWRNVRFSSSGAPGHLPPDNHVVFFRIFQEAISNSLKHSQARNIDVVLDHGAPCTLTVTDDGQGFDEGSLQGAGLGLANIRKRAALVGARCTVRSIPGTGTTIAVEA